MPNWTPIESGNRVSGTRKKKTREKGELTRIKSPEFVSLSPPESYTERECVAWWNNRILLAVFNEVQLLFSGEW